MSTAARPSAPPVARRPNPLNTVIMAVFSLVAFVALGLLVNIVTEWVELVCFWPEEGAAHSARVLETELGYLRRDYRRSVFSADPAAFAAQWGSLAYHYSGLAALVGWLGQPAAQDPEWLGQSLGPLRRLLAPWAEFIGAAAYSVQLYGVRLAVVALSVPALLVIGLVAVVDGLVQRDLRRFGGGTESAFVYHQLKRWIKPLLWLALVVYLNVPVSLHPAWVFVPAAALVAFLTARTVARFKKFL